MATTLASQVQELYVGYLGRAADKAGLDFWVKAIESGTSTLESVALGFTLSEEYKAQYAGLTTTQLVAKVYQNVLGRAADADGLAFWAGEVNKGVIKAETLVKTMISSLGAIDQLTIDNKVAAANTYTEAAGANYSVEAGKAAVAGAGVGTVPGVVNPSQTFTLTAGNDFADNSGFILSGGVFSNAGFKFSASNEAVNASNLTLLAGDILVDSNTADSDVLNVALAATPASAATVQNLETLNLNATNAAAAVFDVANFTGLKTVNVTGLPTNTVTINNIATTTGLTTVDASTVTTAAGGVIASFAASTSTAALTLKGGAGADVFISGLGNDTVTGGAGADRLITGGGTDTVAGDGGADIIDAGSGDDVITGGAGADIIIAGDGADKVTGGAGADTIVLGSVAGRAFAAGDTILLADGTTVSAALEAGDTTAYANGQMSFNNLDDGEVPVDFAARNIVAGDFAVQAGSTVSALAVTAAGSNTVVFEAAAVAGEADNIYGFNTGTVAAGGDILDFSAFLGTAAKVVVYNGADANADNLAAYNVVVNNNAAATDAVTYAANTKYVIIQEGAVNTTISYMTTDGAGAAGTATVVATLVGVNTIDGFLATQAI